MKSTSARALKMLDEEVVVRLARMCAPAPEDVLKAAGYPPASEWPATMEAASPSASNWGALARVLRREPTKAERRAFEASWRALVMMRARARPPLG